MFLLILILLAAPILFQLRMGSKVAFKSMSNRFLIYSVISIVGEVFLTIIGCYLVNLILRHKEIRDGMPIVGTILIGAFFGLIILFIIGLQLYAMFTDNEKQ